MLADQHDIVIRDARIQNLEEENAELLETLHKMTQIIEHYARQHNGFLAQQFLVELQGGH